MLDGPTPVGAGGEAKPQVTPTYVALDRDGTIIRHVHHLVRPSDVTLISGAGDAIARLNRLNIPTIVVTNQSVIGRGLLTAEGLDQVHCRLRQLLTEHGAHVDAIVYCPHHPDEGCNCRKPKPTMLMEALQSLKLGPQGGVVIGDSTSDIHMGQVVGAKVIHVQSGVVSELPVSLNVLSVPDLLAAVDALVGLSGKAGSND